jgi:Mrp family chromosome partitioning ATPase
MKKYTKPALEVVELQAKENIAANPLAVTSVTTSGGRTTTVYNLAVLSESSLND